MSRSDHESDAPARIVRRSFGAGPGLKAIGIVLAWIGGVGCGWSVYQQASLLEAVLRGAGAWLALLVVWLAAVSFCQRYILSQSSGPRIAEMGEHGGSETGMETGA